VRLVTDFVFPVFGGAVEHRGALRTLKATEVSGTAFSVGQGWFVTAAHVVKAAAALGHVAVARLASDYAWEFATAEEVHCEESLDLAFLRAALEPVMEHKWRADSLPMFLDVTAVGYPYGRDPERPHIDARGFKGSVVTPTQFLRLQGAPDIYELSFSAPRGLSGGSRDGRRLRRWRRHWKSVHRDAGLLAPRSGCRGARVYNGEIRGDAARRCHSINRNTEMFRPRNAEGNFGSTP
jgi:hypothetical protein